VVDLWAAHLTALASRTWIVESAPKNRLKHFVIDGEAVVLGVDGIPDFNALHPRKADAEVQLYAFDILALEGEDLLKVPLSIRKQQKSTSSIVLVRFRERQMKRPQPIGGWRGLEPSGSTDRGVRNPTRKHQTQHPNSRSGVLIHESECPNQDSGFSRLFVAARPVMAVARDQSHPLVLADDDQAATVAFDFMEPFGARRHGFAGGRKAGRISASHGLHIGFGYRYSVRLQTLSSPTAGHFFEEPRGATVSRVTPAR
jgi:hypothetical protein